MSDFISGSIAKVRDANPKRRMDNINRRLFKMYEEAGEFAQAYLHVTSNANAKAKLWHDVREEGIDAMIPILDVLLTPMPDQYSSTNGYVELERLATEPMTFHNVLDEDEGLRFFVRAGKFSESYLAAKYDRNETPASWGAFRLAGVRALQKLVNMLVQEMPDQAGSSEEQRFETLAVILDQKLEKWRQNRINRKQTTDDDEPEDDV